MFVYGTVKEVKGQDIVLKLHQKDVDKILRYREGKTLFVELRIEDGRMVTGSQRNKYYATVRDISKFIGETPKYMHKYFKKVYCEKNNIDGLSMKDCSITQAREMINIVIDFALAYDIPLKNLALNRTDDIDAYLYKCLLYRRCCCCGKPADIHHCTGSRVGMGMDRNSIDNVGRYAIALCRNHHTIAHNSEIEFFNKWKVYGIKLDKYLVEKLDL